MRRSTYNKCLRNHPGLLVFHSACLSNTQALCVQCPLEQLPQHATKLNKLTLHICLSQAHNYQKAFCQTSATTLSSKCTYSSVKQALTGWVFCSGMNADGGVWGRVEAGMHWVVENPVKAATMVGLTAVGAMVVVRRRRLF